MRFCTEANRDQVRYVLEQRPVSDRCHQPLFVELAGETTRVELVMRQATQKSVGPIQNERRVAGNPRIRDPHDEKEDEGRCDCGY